MGRVSILEQLKRNKRLLIAVNVLFAALAVSGQVGQNVTLPLWASAASPSCVHHAGGHNDSNASNQTNGTSYEPSMDPFFVVSSASFSFVIIFGVLTLVSALFKAVTAEDLRFPQWQLFLIGFFDALNGILVVYASPPARTAPFLQAILGNFMIPLTIVFRCYYNCFRNLHLCRYSYPVTKLILNTLSICLSIVGSIMCYESNSLPLASLCLEPMATNAVSCELYIFLPSQLPTIIHTCIVL